MKMMFEKDLKEVRELSRGIFRRKAWLIVDNPEYSKTKSLAKYPIGVKAVSCLCLT